MRSLQTSCSTAAADGTISSLQLLLFYYYQHYQLLHITFSAETLILEIAPSKCPVSASYDIAVESAAKRNS